MTDLLVIPSPRSPEYLIESILPSREVHLVAGPTGSGKTTWLFQTLLEWEKGNPVLGFKSHPVPWVYVAADRKLESMARTVERMCISPERIPTIPARDDQMSVCAILDAVKAKRAKLVVWENFGGYVDPPGHKHQVQSFLFSLDRPIRDLDITIIGVMEETKMKQRDKYENPRQRISGVATWGHLCDTIFVIEPEDLENPESDERVLYVCSRNSMGMKIALKFKAGLLVPDDSKYRV